MKPIVTLLVFSAPFPAFAHPGHGSDPSGSSLAHYLTDPLHAPLAILAALVLFSSALLARHRQRSRR